MISEEPRVLVVEDDRKTADIIRAYLVKEGYRVTTAGRGPRACWDTPERCPGRGLCWPTEKAW